ncbi:MAG: sigma-54 dependent transcriptional regulator [Planctomycetota bacterium]|jgi:DNA-binding NtrC family response regulator|nr:sigma-54 dependent transcriptional regulator [Planctomycetota bacterium]
MLKALIIDDEESFRIVLSKYLQHLRVETSEVESGEEGLDRLKDEGFDLILLDIVMKGMDGIQTLRRIKEMRPQLPVVMVTSQSEADLAIEAMRDGAHDYLTKPIDREKLREVVSESQRLSRLQVNVEFGQNGKPPPQKDRIIGQAPEMMELFKDIGRVSDSNASVLINGETGTGKELVARAIVQHSRRAAKPFLTVNSSAMPENLLESLLFGHEQGAFTGASERHIGKFEQADGGTLFLDEIGELSMATQAKLLRVLQEKTFERVGGQETIVCDVRIIAATHRDLAQEVLEGRFREDLFYRLNVTQLQIPPLRDRVQDIPEIASYLIDQIEIETGKGRLLLSVETIEALLDHEWPGNVRELRNVLTRAALKSPTNAILPEHLSFDETAAKGDRKSAAICPITLKDLDAKEEGIYPYLVDELERVVIEYAIKRTKGNQVHASRLLGISRNMIRERLKRFGIQTAGSEETD